MRIAIGGLWVLTLYEYMVTLFRLDERAKAYFAFTIGNVLLAIPLTVTLVVGLDAGAEGLLLGSYLAGLPFLLWLIWTERKRLSLRPERELLRRMFRFGLPTMPAEISIYSLAFIDRIIISHALGAAQLGLYALAFKFSQAIQVVVRGFQLAWPPLAYSIRDDEEARRAYAVVVTAFTALCGFIVVGMWLEARWIVRLLAAPEFFDSYEAIGPLALGAALYGVYLALVVILGRTGKTEYNFPVTIVATIANVALNLILVPAWGIVGAGVALIASYLIVIVLIYGVSRRIFPIPWQWGRLAVVVGAGGRPGRRRRPPAADRGRRRLPLPPRRLRPLPGRPLVRRRDQPRRARPGQGPDQRGQPPRPPGRHAQRAGERERRAGEGRGALRAGDPGSGSGRVLSVAAAAGGRGSRSGPIAAGKLDGRGPDRAPRPPTSRHRRRAGPALLGKEREGAWRALTPVRARIRAQPSTAALQPPTQRWNAARAEPPPLSAKPPSAPARALGASVPRVPRLRRLADPLALRPPRLAGVEQVPARVVAGKHQRRQRPRQVRESGQRPDRRRGRRAVVLAHVEVAVAVELDDAAAAGRAVVGELLVVDRPGRRHVERRVQPASPRRLQKSVSSE